MDRVWFTSKSCTQEEQGEIKEEQQEGGSRGWGFQWDHLSGAVPPVDNAVDVVVGVIG